MAFYSRRVSFNNIYPTYIDPSHPLHIPPQFKDEQQEQKKSTYLDLNFGFGGASINNIEQHYTTSHNTNVAKRKIPKLPPPPSKSILKKKKYNYEINYTITDNYQDHAIFSDDDEHDEDHDEDQHTHKGARAGSPTTPNAQINSTPTPTTTTAAAAPRRKSFAGMTNEELMALEDSYTKKSTLNIASFNFNNSSMLQPMGHPTSFSNPGGTPKSPAKPQQKVPTPSVPSAAVDKPYPSRPVVQHNACCISAKHRNYDKLYSDLNNRVLLSCITGRRHTWNSIDYIVNDLAMDGDHIVIASHISVKEIEDYKGTKSIAEEKEFESSKSYNISSQLIYEKCQNILDYILKALAPKNLNIQISVEIINCDSSKHVINGSLKLYKPHLVVIGSKTDEDHYKRSASVSSSSSSTDPDSVPAARKPSMPRKLSNTATVSTLGKGYNGFYRVAGVKCTKLTSYVIQASCVPVIVVTSNYNTAIKFKSPFESGIEDVPAGAGDDADQFKNRLIAVSDRSRTKSINEITAFQSARQASSNDGSISSSSDSPKTFHPHPQSGFLQVPQHGAKVTFGDDQGFGNGHSMYKVKSLLDPVENLSVSRTTTRSNNSSGNIDKKKKTERSKSDSSMEEANGAFFSLKKFGFGKKK